MVMESDEEQDRKVPAMTTKNDERTAAEDDEFRGSILETKAE